MKAFIELRFYATGWVFRIGNTLLRWANHEQYRSLTVEVMKNDLRLSGGMNFKQWNTRRKQKNE